MPFEEEHADVLQNIEFAIVNVYRDQPNVLDYDVEEALDALIRYYKAERGDRSPKSPRFSDERTENVYDAVKSMCAWRLGRTEMTDVEGHSLETQPEPKSLEDIIACLKRIRKSVRKWNKRGGRQGYLDFVEPYL